MWERLTFCCIHRHGISSLVSFLVLGYHHLDIQLFQSLFWYRDTNITTVTLNHTVAHFHNQPTITRLNGRDPGFKPD
jgi:hypothetical protein